MVCADSRSTVRTHKGGDDEPGHRTSTTSRAHLGRAAVRRDRPRDAARRPGSDDPGHGAPGDRARSRLDHRPLVGRQRLCRRRSGDDAPVGQARRPPRAQAAARGRAERVRRVLGAVRRRAGHPAADRAAARPGRGRRRPDDAGDGRRGRSRLDARARALPGLHRDDVRRRDDRRAAAGRPAGRPRELALGLLRQPAGRRPRARRARLATARRRRPSARTARWTSRARRCWPAPPAR